MFIGPTLGRYFAARFARTVLGVFVTVFALVYTLDFVELLRRAGETQGASTGLMAQLSLYRTPAVAEGVLPFAVLFGSMAALLQLSAQAGAGGRARGRHLGVAVPAARDLRGAGPRVRRRVRDLQPGLGDAEAALHRDRDPKIFAKATKASSGKDLWIRQRGVDGEAILRAETAIEGTTILSGVTVFVFDASGQVRGPAGAGAHATLHDGYWELTDVRVLTPRRGA